MQFNGIKKNYITVLRGRDRPVWASRTREMTERGNRLKKTRIEPRVITVPVKIAHDGFSDLQKVKEDIAGWLVSNVEKKLVFSDDPERYYMAVVDGLMGLEEFIYWGEGEIEFLCPTPFKFGTENNLSLSSTFQAFEITGQAETPWTSYTRFSAPQSQYVLENNIGGKIIMNYSFITGDVLKIDYFKRKITLNGENLAVALSLFSHWFDLTPGFVYLQASHATTLKYVERYY